MVTLKDSVSYREVVKFDTLRIPAAEASVRIQLDSIPVSYSGIIGYDRQGPATVQIIREQGGAIRAIATCDSVMQLLVSKLIESENRSSSDHQQYREKVVYRTPPFFTWLTIIGVLFALAALAWNVRKIISPI